jgi:hypothetical protein
VADNERDLPAWKEYQSKAAALFRSMGFDAEVEATIEGARGKHVIDVLVAGAIFGVKFRWIVECKAWKTNIPKEKVLALLAIIQDIGADRGFLLSETGFQSGAVRSATDTNITLSSIEDLEEAARQSIVQGTAAQLHWRLTKVKQALWRLHKQTGDYMSDHLRPMGEISILDLAIEDAIHGRFPIVYAFGSDNDRLTAKDWSDFASKASEQLDKAESYIAKSAPRGERG